MNNLKRVLSLGMAGTMLAGMMTAGAADFTDAEEINHTEAVNVMSTLGVLKGKDTGAFDPKGTVTRAEMAKIICVMLNGGEDPTLGTSSAPKFTDITNHWARSYIEYCANLGIINGRGDGTFDPNGEVTGAQAAKMLLVAMGYDSSVFGFTGIDWELAVNSQANEAKLYEEIKKIDTSAPLTRDDVAQMAYNALEAKVMNKTYDKVVNNGQISYNYSLSSQTFLNKYFGGEVFIGTYVGNYDTGAATNDGEIAVDGNLDTDATGVAIKNATLPSDMDISNIGEQVKVIYKEGKGGISGQPDKKDTIYGVFNTESTVVYTATLNDVKDTAKDANKIKIGSTQYKIATPAAGDTLVVRNYDDAAKTTASAGTDATRLAQAKSVFEALKSTNNGSTVKFVTNDNGEITTAYVVDETISYVTAINSGKVTLSGVGSIVIEDNDIYEGIAKNDVVTYTRYYNNSDKDKAFFTVTKAESVSGKLNSYKGTKTITLDDTAYSVKGESYGSSVTIDSETSKTSLTTSEIGEGFTAYMVGGYVGYLFQDADSQNKYALVIDANTGKLDSTFDVPKAQLLLADGTKVTATIHKDSVIYTTVSFVTSGATLATGNAISDGAGAGALEVGQIVKYAVTDEGVYKITEVGTYDASMSASTVYDKDTKSFTIDGGTTTVVTAGDCPLFLKESGSYKVYNIRNLNNIAVAASTTAGYATKDGKVVAAYAELAARPSGAVKNAFYGIVSSYKGTLKVNGDFYNKYIVENAEEELTVLLPTGSTLSTGSLVSFDRAEDNTYTSADITVFNGSAYDSTNGLATWVKEYNEADQTLTVWGALTGNATTGYIGTAGSEVTYALDDNCVIAYVDMDNGEAGDEIGINTFDGVTGYTNILLVKDSSNNKIVGIIVESSGDANIAGGLKSVAAADISTSAGVKALSNGVYTTANDGVTTTIGGITLAGTPSQNILVKYTAVVGNNYNLSVKDASGSEVYAETYSSAAGTTGFFVFNTIGANDPLASGSYASTAFASGTYTATVTDTSSSNAVVTTGTFIVE